MGKYWVAHVSPDTRIRSLFFSSLGSLRHVPPAMRKRTFLRKDYELHALFENLPVQPGYEGGGK